MSSRTTCYVTGCSNPVSRTALFVALDGAVSEVSHCQEHVRNLGMDWVIPTPAAFPRDFSRISYVDCGLSIVSLEYAAERFALVLKTSDAERVFVAQTGYTEACWISYIVERAEYPAPPTHVLLVRILEALGGSLVEATVDSYDFDRNAYRCQLVLEAGGRSMKIASRVSDAVAMAYVVGCPIRVNAAFLGYDYK